MANEVTDITLEKITQDSPLIEVPKLDLEQITTQLLKAGDVDIPTSEIKLTGEEKIIVFTTPFFLDTFHNAASNIEGACKTLQNFHTHRKMLETREGVYSPNSALYEPSAADSKVVTALFRFYDKDGGNTEGTDKVFFARTWDTTDNVEGFIYWSGSAWVHLALPADVTMSAAYVGDYKQQNNKAYYSDGNSQVMELGFVNGTLKALKAGIPTPDFELEIDSCEDASTNWVVSYSPTVAGTHGNITTDEGYVRKEKGDYSLQFRAKKDSASTVPLSVIFTKTLASTLDFTNFKNTEDSSNNDFIAFRLYRYRKLLLDSIAIEFSSESTIFTKSFSVSLYGEITIDHLRGVLTTASTYFTDSTQDMTKYQTTGLNARFMVALFNAGGTTVGVGYLGTAFGSGNHSIYVHTVKNPLRVANRGWIGTTTGATSYTIYDWEKGIFTFLPISLNGILGEYSNNPYDYVGFDVRIRKSWFKQVSTPNWNDIRAYRIIMKPNIETATESDLTDPPSLATINIDNLRLLKCPPILIDMKVQCATMDGTESWVAAGGGTVDRADNICTQGMSSIKISAGETAELTFATDKDWTYYGSPDIERNDATLFVTNDAWIIVDVGGMGGGNKKVKITFTDTSAATAFKEIAYNYQTNPKGNLSGSGWNTISGYKSAFTGYAAFDWENVSKISIKNDTGDPLWCDNLRIEPYKKTKLLESFDYMNPAETSVSGEITTYTFTDRTMGFTGEGWMELNYDPKYTDVQMSEVVSTDIRSGSMHLKAEPNNSVTLLISLTVGEDNLTTYGTEDGAATSISDDDLFEIWAMKDCDPGDIGEITIRIYYDSNAGAGTPVVDTNNYWDYDFTADYTKEIFKKNKSTRLTFRKGDLVFMGTTAASNDLTYVAGYAIILQAGKDNGSKMYFDTFRIRHYGTYSGTYWGKIKNVNTLGERSASSEVSFPINLSNSDMLIYEMAKPYNGATSVDNRIAGKELYIMGGTSTEYRYANTYPADCTSAVLSIKEENFGEVMGPDYYEPPPKVEVIELVNNQMLYFNVTGWDNRKYPSYLYWSRSSMPGQVSKLDFMPISNEDGQWGMGIANFYNYTLAFKNYSTYVVDIESRSYVRKSEVYGLIAKRGLTVTPYGVAFLSHQGLILTDVSSFDDKWAEPINNIFTDAFETYGDRYLKIAICAYLDKFFYIFFDQTNAGKNNKCLCCYMPDGAKGWKELVLRKQTDAIPTYASIDVRSVAISGDPALSSTESRTIFLGDEVGRIYQMNRGDYDVCDTYTKIPIVGKLQTFDVDLGTPQNIKQILSMYHNSARASTDNGSITFTPYYNQQAGTATSVQSITSAYFGRSSKLPLKSGQGSLMGMYLETGTKTMAITAFADAGGGNVTVTVAAHGLLDTIPISISGTTNYNGDYVVANAVTNTFTIIATWVATETGTLSTYRGRLKIADMPVNYTDRGMV